MCLRASVASGWHNACEGVDTTYLTDWRITMNTMKRVVAAAALASLPLMAFAQADTVPSNDSLTRAQVKQDQMNVEQAGYNNAIGDQTTYPRQAQAAEARVGAEQVQAVENSGYGGVMSGSSESGGSDSSMMPAHTAGAAGTKPVYFGR
jgi:hypothetical protein